MNHTGPLLYKFTYNMSIEQTYVQESSLQDLTNVSLPLDLSHPEYFTNSKEDQRITGRVKWFNNKAGFGFVTAVDGDLKDKDVFVHYSSIDVPDDHYKYLVQGEYVDFELSSSEKSEHEFHAIQISGVKGGTLMCETRRQNLETRPYKPRIYKTPDDRTFPNKDESVTNKGSTKKQYIKHDINDNNNAGYMKIPERYSKPNRNG